MATVDVLAEGIHFRLDWTSFRDLGYKAAAVNLSDLAAMGAEAEGLLVGLGAPADAEVEQVVELYEGLNEAGVPVVGGDTTRAPSWFLSVTAFGTSERVPGRAGAVPGDVLVVTGSLGGSAAGRHVLEHGLEGFDELVEAHRRPPLRLEEGRALARVAHALVDLSDGIGSDAARIAERSGCKVVLDLEAIPHAPRIDEVADLPFWTLGEDYELLAALASEDARRERIHRRRPVRGRLRRRAATCPAGTRSGPRRLCRASVPRPTRSGSWSARRSRSLAARRARRG